MNHTFKSITAAFALAGALGLSGCAEQQPKAGDTLPDGSIYAGGGLIAAAKDLPNSPPLLLNQAMDQCAHLIAHGRDDWILPNGEQLETLYKAQNINDFSGTFRPDIKQGWYWSFSSTTSETNEATTTVHAQMQNFITGTTATKDIGSLFHERANARCVRVDPGLE